MLNDIARPTRLMLAGFGIALGVIVSGTVTGRTGGVALALLLGGLGLEVLVLLGLPVVLGRAERRFRELVVAASAEIATGAVVPVPALGRVVRRRIVRLPWWMPGRGAGAGPSVMVVLTAVGDGPARRVAAVVPADLGLHLRHVPAELLVHPRHRDVAVVDDRVTHERLVAIDADPRWGTERLPTDRTVVGGYVALVASLVVGAAVGAGLGTLVVTLAT
ncbi:hypothetical protein [Nocardioides plantarum]|uniref:Uncharacterized protein n=1 Tax=Nocardioides plantarum TaxID=29299 RepID=A0ABV5KE07_9ACTN|nr:hypothetical protein [Nocardioides plantarum]